MKIDAPTIIDLTNMNHTHASVDQGGVIGYVPYTGATSSVDFNAQSIKNFFISKTADVTAKFAFDVSALSTATIRTFKVIDASGTLLATTADGATTEMLVGGGAAVFPVWTTATGSGSPVRATSPTLVTPLLGTPTSGDLTNCVLFTAPVTKTADFTLAAGETWVINNKAAATCTVTLPAASSWSGRMVTFKNLQAFTLVSNSSNVVPIDSVSAGTAILLAVVGNWATLVSDGTNWVIMQQAPNNILLLE